MSDQPQQHASGDHSNAGGATGGAASSAASSDELLGSVHGTQRFSTRVKGAPSKLLEELIAAPQIKKRRATSLGRPPKGGKPGSLERLYEYQRMEMQKRQFMMGMNPAFRGFMPGMPGMPGAPGSFPGLPGYPALAATAASLAPGAGTLPPGAVRPGGPTPAAASHVHGQAFPAVPVAPGHAMAHSMEEDWMDEQQTEDLARSNGELVTLLGQTRCCALTPSSFFVAWHGVLTLSFSGFTTNLAALKTELAALEVPWALPIEQSGSKWPKLTLACLKEGRTLTVDQLRKLEQITSSFRETVRADPWRMAVRELSYVKFACRSLERVLLRTDVPLKDSLVGRAAAAAAAAGMAGVLARGLPQDVPAMEAAKVENVLAELTSAEGSVETYLQHVNKNGGRENHYKNPHSESSLVVFAAPARAPQAAMSRAPLFLEQFRQQVDAALPDYYEWFPWNSLHCTVRTMA